MLGLERANSSEFDPKSPHPVVIFMPEISQSQMGGTMRLGASADWYPCSVGYASEARQRNVVYLTCRATMTIARLRRFRILRCVLPHRRPTAGARATMLRGRPDGKPSLAKDLYGRDVSVRWLGYRLIGICCLQNLVMSCPCQFATSLSPHAIVRIVLVMLLSADPSIPSRPCSIVVPSAGEVRVGEAPPPLRGQPRVYGEDPGGRPHLLRRR